MNQGSRNELTRFEDGRLFARSDTVEGFCNTPGAKAWINLQAHGGEQRWMRSMVAARILGKPPKWIDKAIRYRILQGRGMGTRQRWVLLDPANTFAAMRAKFTNSGETDLGASDNEHEHEMRERAFGLKPAVRRTSSARIILRNEGGRTLARSRAVEGPDRGDGQVDLESLGGTETWMRAHVAAALVGKELKWIRRLRRLGIIRGEERNGNPWVWFDSAWRVPDLRSRYLSSLAAPSSYGEFEHYNACRRALGMLAAEPHPDIVIDAALIFLEDMNGLVERVELNGLLDLPQDNPTGLIQELYRRRGAYRRRRRSSVPIDAIGFQAILPPAIASASGTCYDEDAVETRPAPPESILGRLAALGPLRETASLAVLRLAGRGTGTVFLQETMRMWERMDDLIETRGIDPQDQNAITVLLDAIAAGKLPEDEESGAVRDLTARLWLWAAAELAALAQASQATARTDLWPYVPATHRRPAELKRRLRKSYGHLRKEGVSRRKELSDRLSADFDFLIAAARRRCDQLADFADDGIEEARALALDDVPYRDWETSGWVLSPDANYGPGVQNVLGRVWREEALWEHLHDLGALKEMPRVYADYRQARSSGASYGTGRLVFEYRGVTSEFDGGTAEPFFATIFSCGAPVAPKLMPRGMKDARRMLIKSWRMPGYVCPAAGLLSFGCNGTTLFRAAAHAGMVLLPLEEFDHAMRIGHLAFRSSAITGCRSHELQQMTARRDGWPVLEIGQSARTGWLAIPKQDRYEQQRAPDKAPERFFMVDDDTYVYACDLIRVLSRRCYAGGSVPQMDSATRIAWKCGPAPYIFSMNGKALTHDAINSCIRYLLAGLVPTSMHPIRHASANRGWIEGDQIEDVMERLNQSTIRMAKHYARPSEQQCQQGVASFADRRSERQRLRHWEVA